MVRSIIFGFGLIRNLVFFFFPLYFLSIGLSGIETGILIGIFAVTGILFSFHAGIHTDRISQKTLLAIGLLLFVIFCTGLLLTQSFWILIPFFFIGGLSRTIVNRTTDTLIYKNIKKQGKELGYLFIIKVLAIAVGIIIGAQIIERVSFRAVFLISIVLILPLIIPTIKLKTTALFNFPVAHYLKEFKNKKVLFFFIVIFIFSLHFGAEQTAYTPYLKENLGLSLIGISYFIAGVIIFYIASSLVVGKLIDRGFKKLNLLYFAMLLSGIGAIIFSSTRQLALAYVGRAIHDIGDGAFFVTMSAGMLKLFDKNKIGGHSGFISSIIIFATFIGSIIFGHVGFTYGFQWPHIISGSLSVLAFLILGSKFLLSKKP